MEVTSYPAHWKLPDTARALHKLPSCDENDVHELYIDVSKVRGQYHAVIISSLTEERMLAFPHPICIPQRLVSKVEY